MRQVAGRFTSTARPTAMPDKPLTVAGYAAGASLAAIALVFVFGPTFFIDGEESGVSRRARKKGVVGLFNPANDCFINAVLQSLAGLGDLRTYLIRECHRRSLDHELYESLGAPAPGVDPEKVLGLQKGIVGQALKEVLDRLNERPIYKKTISATNFVRILEGGFRQRISRQQQDAQEFLQVVAERLSEEYHAGRRVRARARRDEVEPQGEKETGDAAAQSKTEADGATGGGETSAAGTSEPSAPAEEEGGFPLEGKLSSQIECLKCSFKPKPSLSTFVTLTLHVPHDSTSTTLSHCFDILLKTEYIDDFKCDRCRLLYAHSLYTQQLSRSTSSSTPTHAELSQHIAGLEHALATDPEHPPKDLPLPTLSSAPTSRIARHVSLVTFPKIIAIHLSRSIFDPYSASTKNSAKVSFPERLPLGGLLNQKQYKLLGMVTHKGSHNSGHYESFRRQNIYPPFSTPDTFKPSEAYSLPATPSRSPARSPEIAPSNDGNPADVPRASISTTLDVPDLPSPGSELDSTPSSASLNPPATSASASAPTSAPKTVITPPPSSSSDSQPSSPQPPTHPTNANLNRVSLAPSVASTAARSPSIKLTKSPKQLQQQNRKAAERWWRISDEKIKEARTSDVLGQQREVYLLFYEMDRETLLGV